MQRIHLHLVLELRDSRGFRIDMCIEQAHGEIKGALSGPSFALESIRDRSLGRWIIEQWNACTESSG